MTENLARYAAGDCAMFVTWNIGQVWYANFGRVSGGSIGATTVAVHPSLDFELLGVIICDWVAVASKAVHDRELAGVSVSVLTLRVTMKLTVPEGMVTPL